MKKYLIISTLLLVIVSIGCAKKKTFQIEETEVSKSVAKMLSEASEDSHANLAMLARLRGLGAIPLIPAPDESLSKNISISWTGRADRAIKEICLKIGYIFKEKGRNRVQELPIVVKGFNRPAYDLLEDIAWQILPTATLRVDTIKRTITLGHLDNGDK